MKLIANIIMVLHVFSSVCFAEHYVVEKVQNGHVLKLTNGDRVRLIGVETPEDKATEKAKRASEQTGKELSTIVEEGQKATKFVSNLVKGKSIVLKYDKLKVDKWGKILAYVWFEEDPQAPSLISDGTYWEFLENDKGQIVPFVFLNATVIKSGYATPVKNPHPNLEQRVFFEELYKEALQNNRGLHQ